MYVDFSTMFCIVVQFRLFLTKYPQKAKVSQEQKSTQPYTSTLTSAIDSVSHIKDCSYGENLYIIIIILFLHLQKNVHMYFLHFFWVVCFG